MRSGSKPATDLLERRRLLFLGKVLRSPVDHLLQLAIQREPLELSAILVVEMHTCMNGQRKMHAVTSHSSPNFCRGYVWGPMAQLTYWSLQEYDHVSPLPSP